MVKNFVVSDEMLCKLQNFTPHAQEVFSGS
jgi:hypothetical protein